MTIASKPFVSFLACALILPSIMTTMCIRGFDTKDPAPNVTTFHMNSIASVISFPSAPVTYPITTAVSTNAAAIVGLEAAQKAASMPAVVSEWTSAVVEPAAAISAEPAVEVNNSGSDTGVISDIRSTLISADNRPCLWVGQKIASYALKYDGYRYVYGSANPSVGFDCSGFAYYVYGQFGYALPRTATGQHNEGTSVSKEDLRPGDLVFFTTDGSGSVSHVGIYIGNNQFINATSTGNGVMICGFDSNYWSKAYVGAKRIVTDTCAWVAEAAILQKGM